MRAWAIGIWLFRQGQDRLQRNLTQSERRALLELMRKSKGRRRNLSEKERSRFVGLVRKAATGRGG